VFLAGVTGTPSGPKRFDACPNKETCEQGNKNLDKEVERKKDYRIFSHQWPFVFFAKNLLVTYCQAQIL